jgi:hypothetical protein
VFLVNSRSHLVTATPTSLQSKSDHQQGRTFSRSYGTNLPSSFTRVLSSALGFSPHPPVSVYGTVRYYLKLRSFSWKHGIDHFPAQRPVVSYLDIKSPDLPKLSAYLLSPGQPTPGRSSLLRHSIAVITSTGILTSFPSTTPFGLALGADSPCAD